MPSRLRLITLLALCFGLAVVRAQEVIIGFLN
jgi:hypothetical protein